MEYRWKRQPLPDPRQRMIDETSAWLTWALRSGKKLPSIPRRRVDLGGFRDLVNVPGAKAAINHWWSRALDAVEALGDRS